MKNTLGTYKASRYVGLSYYKFKFFLDIGLIPMSSDRMLVSDLDTFIKNKKALLAKYKSQLEELCLSQKKKDKERLQNQDLLGVYDAARYLGTRYDNLSRLVKSGQIPFLKQKNKVLIRKFDLDKFRETPRQEAPGGYLDIDQVVELTQLPRYKVYSLLNGQPYISIPKSRKRLYALNQVLLLIPSEAET